MFSTLKGKRTVELDLLNLRRLEHLWSEHIINSSVAYVAAIYKVNLRLDLIKKAKIKSTQCSMISTTLTHDRSIFKFQISMDGCNYLTSSGSARSMLITKLYFRTD